MSNATKYTEGRSASGRRASAAITSAGLRAVGVLAVGDDEQVPARQPGGPAPACPRPWRRQSACRHGARSLASAASACSGSGADSGMTSLLSPALAELEQADEHRFVRVRGGVRGELLHEVERRATRRLDLAALALRTSSAMLPDTSIRTSAAIPSRGCRTIADARRSSARRRSRAARRPCGPATIAAALRQSPRPRPCDRRGQRGRPPQATFLATPSRSAMRATMRAAVQRAFHVAKERVARVLAGEVQAADCPATAAGRCAVTWPGAGNEYDALAQTSDGQSMKRPFTKLGADAL